MCMTIPFQIYFFRVKKTEIRTTNKYGNKKVTVQKSHRDVNVEDWPVGDPKKPKEITLACKYSCG